MPPEVTALLVACVTAISTLSGIWITQSYQVKKTMIEARRWYADHFLGRKLEAIETLLKDMVDCQSAIQIGSSVTTRTEYHERVGSKKEAFRRSLIVASTYLNEEDRVQVQNVLGPFNQATHAIYLGLPEAESGAQRASYGPEALVVDWVRLDDAYQAAMGVLRDEVFPKVFRQDELSRLSSDG